MHSGSEQGKQPSYDNFIAILGWKFFMRQRISIVASLSQFDVRPVEGKTWGGDLGQNQFQAWGR